MDEPWKHYAKWKMGAQKTICNLFIWNEWDYSGTDQYRQSRVVVVRGCEEGETEWLPMDTGFFRGGNENILKLNNGDGCITLWIY